MSETEHVVIGRLMPDRGVTASNEPTLRRQMEDMMAQGVTVLLLDMQRVEAMDSIGVSLLVSVHLALEAKGGGLAVENASEGIRGLFLGMGLDCRIAVNDPDFLDFFTSKTGRNAGVDSLVFKPGLPLTAANKDVLEAEMQRFLTLETGTVIVDLKGVQGVDSMGLSLLVGLHRTLSERGGSIRVVNASGDVNRLLERMRLNEHFSAS